MEWIESIYFVSWDYVNFIRLKSRFILWKQYNHFDFTAINAIKGKSIPLWKYLNMYIYSSDMFNLIDLCSFNSRV